MPIAYCTLIEIMSVFLASKGTVTIVPLKGVEIEKEINRAPQARTAP
jgi:hypothetical protein